MTRSRGLASSAFRGLKIKPMLRARQEIRCAFWRERRAGRCEAPRRRRCRCASSRSGNKADARPPPRPSGLRPAGPLAVLLAPYIPHRVCSSLAPCQRAWGPAAKCTPYFLTALSFRLRLEETRLVLLIHADPSARISHAQNRRKDSIFGHGSCELRGLPALHLARLEGSRAAARESRKRRRENPPKGERTGA